MSCIIFYMCLVIICFPVDIINFGKTLAFLSSRFPAWTKSQDKNLNILRRTTAFMVKMYFFTTFIGLSIKANKTNFFWMSESDFKTTLKRLSLTYSLHYIIMLCISKLFYYTQLKIDTIKIWQTFHKNESLHELACKRASK